MMNHLLRVTSPRYALALAPRAMAANSVGSSYRMMSSLQADLSRKEKVEEDRYIRQKEHEEYLVRKAKEDAENAARELTAAEAAAKELHDQTTSEIFGVLSMTGDKVSDECIGNLAKWKLGN